jgi:hypothetical protein
MAKGKLGALDSVKALSSSLLSRLNLPFLPKPKASAAPEPFSAIEDETPLGDDLLATDNAAPVSRPLSSSKGSVDLGAALAGAFKKPAVLIGSLSVLAVILVIAVVSAIVTSPPKAAKAAPPFTKEGIAVVKTWLPPPGDPLEPRMAMEREGKQAYGPAEAAKLGIPSDPILLATLAEHNDAAIDDLYGTVP